MQQFIRKQYDTGFGQYGYTPSPTAYASDTNALASTQPTGSTFNWNSLIHDTLGNAGGIINSVSNLTHGTTTPPQNVTYVNGQPTSVGPMSTNTLIAIGAVLLLIVILIVVVMSAKAHGG